MSAWPNPPVPSWFRGEDKIVHMGLYGILGLALAHGRRRADSPPPHRLLILLGALYGATDELHQAFVAGRTPDSIDWLADIAGLLVGYGLLHHLNGSGTRPEVE